MTTPKPRVLVQVRLPADLVRQIDHLAVDEDLFRGQTIEHLLCLALTERGLWPTERPEASRVESRPVTDRAVSGGLHRVIDRCGQVR